MGGWQTCWRIPVDTLNCEEKRVCFAYDENIHTNGTQCVSPFSTVNASTVSEGRSGTFCDLLGQGGAWCSFFRFAVQFFNALAIIAGLAGDVLSDKVYVGGEQSVCLA